MISTSPENVAQFLVTKLPSPNVRESKTILDSGFHAVDSRFQLLDSSLCQWNLDSGFQSLVGFRIPGAVFRIPKSKIPDSSYWFPVFVSGTWILDSIVSGILDSLSCILDSKAHDSGFHKQNFLGFRNPDSLTWGDYHQHTLLLAAWS